MNTQFTWLHIGLGSFHRAHQAWYLHRLRVSGGFALAYRGGKYS